MRNHAKSSWLEAKKQRIETLLRGDVIRSLFQVVAGTRQVQDVFYALCVVLHVPGASETFLPQMRRQRTQHFPCWSVTKPDVHIHILLKQPGNQVLLSLS